MKNAPPVAIAVGHFVWGKRITHGLGALAALASTLAAIGYGAQPETLTACALAWVLVWCCAHHLWQREALPAGTLTWDGQTWHFESDNEASSLASIDISWDGGRFVWIRLKSPNANDRRSRIRHTCLSASHNPHQWHSVRCALHQRTPAPATPHLGLAPEKNAPN